MPTVGQPQIFQLPDETAAYQQLGQGGGQLLAALLNYYRSRGPGTYQSPTGEQFPAQAVSRRTPPSPGFTFRPDRLPFLGQLPVNLQQQNQQYQSALLPLQLQQAQSEVAEAPLKRRKLEAETLLTESQSKFLEGLSGSGALGEDGIPGVVLSIDETGKRVPPETPGARQVLVQPTKSGPKMTVLPQPTPERVQAQSAVDSMLQSLDTMEQMLAEDPSRLVRSNIPFMEREFKAVIDQFDKEAAIAAGGKQLTETELNLIRRTRPTIQDVNSPEAIKRKIAKLRQIGVNAKARLAGTTPKEASTKEVDPLSLR
jgi:hypothetical protein